MEEEQCLRSRRHKSAQCSEASSKRSPGNLKTNDLWTAKRWQRNEVDWWVPSACRWTRRTLARSAVEWSVEETTCELFHHRNNGSFYSAKIGINLHDELEGVKDDHAGLGREDPLDVGIGFGVGYSGQRAPAAAVARSPAAADGGVPTEGKGVVSCQGGLEERGRGLVPAAPCGVRNRGWRGPI